LASVAFKPAYSNSKPMKGCNNPCQRQLIMRLQDYASFQSVGSERWMYSPLGSHETPPKSWPRPNLWLLMRAFPQDGPKVWFP